MPIRVNMTNNIFRLVRNEPKNIKRPHPYNRRTIRVQCFPLYSILLALGNPTVDVFSLDIEGAEIKVLETIPWSKVRKKPTRGTFAKKI